MDNILNTLVELYENTSELNLKDEFLVLNKIDEIVSILGLEKEFHSALDSKE